MTRTSNHSPLRTLDAAARKAAGVSVCARCGQPKPAVQFRVDARRGGPISYCRTCDRIVSTLRYHSEAGAAHRAEYLSRPEVVARRRALDAARRDRPDRKASQAAYRLTARGRLGHSRTQARARLRAALAEVPPDPRRVARLAATVEQYDREIARYDAAHARKEGRP